MFTILKTGGMWVVKKLGTKGTTIAVAGGVGAVGGYGAGVATADQFSDTANDLGTKLIIAGTLVAGLYVYMKGAK